MRTARGAAIVTLTLAVACSGGGPAANTFVPPAARNGSPAGAKGVRTALPASLKPPAPARLFVGTASALGQLIRYCQDSTCAEVAPRTPSYLAGTGGLIVEFTLDKAPLQAVAEVRTRPSDKPAIVTLNPGILMLFAHGLGSGRFLVDLVCRWRTSEARWRFGVSMS